MGWLSGVVWCDPADTERGLGRCQCVRIQQELKARSSHKYIVLMCLLTPRCTTLHTGLDVYRDNIALNERINTFFASINNVGSLKGVVQFPTVQVRSGSPPHHLNRRM